MTLLRKAIDAYNAGDHDTVRDVLLQLIAQEDQVAAEKPVSENPSWYSRHALARLCGCSDLTVAHHVRAGNLPAGDVVSPAGHPAWSPDAAHAWRDAWRASWGNRSPGAARRGRVSVHVLAKRIGHSHDAIRRRMHLLPPQTQSGTYSYWSEDQAAEAARVIRAELSSS